MLPFTEDIDMSVCQMVKVALTQALGFREYSPPHIVDLDVIPECAIPCVEELVTLLDAYRPCSLPASMMGRTYPEGDIVSPALVGSIFVDVLLAIVNETKDLTALSGGTLRRILEALIVTIYKHDLDSKALTHLQANMRKAVRRVLMLMSPKAPYELQQLVLSLCQAFIQRSRSLHLAIVS
jgi:hypothetical protein